MIFLLWLSLGMMGDLTPPPPVFDTNQHAAWWGYYQARDDNCSYSQQVDRFYDLAILLHNQNPNNLNTEEIWSLEVGHWIKDYPEFNTDEE